ncbi:5'/3'-nucleotidase SurE [Candidatus Bathycorpusculum sp.]|uniref:5'/3'-nucleotidase SurE n=1 Tax=Candidatus Bathycorpusculum sp. TaxID=2994959 RepID=UPI00282BF0E5|nr:5'/3'-nucleotidase SurE [Candidatus Termitimicrobium sp.]
MKPLILITNDDGVLSPGIRAAAEAIIDFSEVLIVAPTKQQTSMGRSFPKSDDVGIIDKIDMEIAGKKIIAYGVHGSPATSVSHAVLEIANRKIDLCISGINYGENLGLGLSCSGTIGAALEADTYGIPAIAVSLEVVLESQHSSDFAELNWIQTKRIIRIYAKRVLAEGLGGDISLLNINIPNDATNDTPIELTKQSRQNYFFFKKPEKRNFSEKLRLQSYIDIDHATLEEDSDICCFAKRRNISVTPITWNMTARDSYQV